MFSEFYVENFALIEKLQLNLAQGLNVITGETGAGKSIIIDAVGLLLGSRAQQNFIRRGTEKCLIQGTFTGPFSDFILKQLADGGIEVEDNSLILSREINISGNNICRINLRPVPLSFMRSISRYLINIHGQKEHALLLEAENQLYTLDNYGGENIFKLKEDIAKVYQKLKSKEKAYAEFSIKKKTSIEKQEFLKYQLNEINNAQLEPGEEETIRKELSLMQNAEHIKQTSLKAKNLLSKSLGKMSILEALNDSALLIEELSEIDKSLTGHKKRLESAYYEIEDIASELGSYQFDIVSDTRDIDKIENRLITIRDLKRKYGNSIDEILEKAAKMQDELDLIENQDYYQEELEKAIKKYQNKYSIIANKLTEARKIAAQKLSKEIENVLIDLSMPKAKFSIDVRPGPISKNGQDIIEFIISPNTGEKLMPVAKIASGGEMARIMLAIKVILSKLDEVPTIIFDEIDTGLGGKTLGAVAQKLAIISKNTQVICVTHAPIIAAYAYNHLFIDKISAQGRTISRIKQLNQKEILTEIARMLAGDDISDTTLKQAQELLDLKYQI